MEGGAEQDAAGRGEAAADAGQPGGERVERFGLPAVHRVVGRVGAGEVAEGEDGREAGEKLGGGVEVGGVEAEPVHAGIELQRAGASGEFTGEVAHLAAAVEARHEVEVAEGARVARHQPGEDVDRRAGAERLAEPDAFLGECDEVGADAGGGQRWRHLCRAEAVGIGLDHGGGLHGRRGKGVEGAPVGGDGPEIDAEAGAGDGGCSLPVAGSAGRIRDGRSSPCGHFPPRRECA